MSDLELLAHTTGDWLSVDALLDDLASRPSSSFMLPHESPQETARLLNHYYPEHISTILAAADEACKNVLSLNGQIFNFSQNIDWHKEPVTGCQWPRWHVSRLVQYLRSEARPADLRFSWELNRHQHFTTLGIAYWLTGEQRYLDVFSSQIQDWIETNPLQHGINWCSSLEISIRLLTWMTAFQFFRGSPEFRSRVGRAFLKSLWQQTDFLSKHLQTTDIDDVPNNHLIGELTGLALVGTIFPEFIEAQTWRETSLRMLAGQALEQTHPDGINKEQATGYHRFVTELLLLTVVRNRRDVLQQEPMLKDTLGRMLDYMLFSLTPVGTASLWGDSDYGRVLQLGQNKDFGDFRPILSAGSALFGRADWKFAAGSFAEEAFWLLGIDGLELWEQLDICSPEQTSRAFPQAGLYIIRDAWSAVTDVAFFRCGPFGLGGEGSCAHAHCDLLSFVLWVNGQPLLVDSGTYAYHGSLRDTFRLTAAHNAVMIDGFEQAKPMAYFNWQQIPDAKCLEWTGKRVTGALTCVGQVEFIRELAHPQPGIWDLVDKFIGRAGHKLEWFFHFAPGLDIQPNAAGCSFTVFKDGQPFLILQAPDNGMCFEARDTWYSDRYGSKQPNRELYAQWRGEVDDRNTIFRWQFKLLVN
jgi:hypothetical protein